MPKTSIDTAHAEIAKTIRLAKKRMFKAHREGVPLPDAADQFVTQVAKQIADQSQRLGIAEIVGHSKERPPTYEHVNPIRDRNALADAVGEILKNEFAPPGLRDAVVGYVTDNPPLNPEAVDDTEQPDTPIVGNAYVKAMEALGLDWPTIDLIADEYKSSGEDDHLVLTIGLLRRLQTLLEGKGQPEDIRNYLPMLIDRLYRATYHCETMSETFAQAAEARLPRVESQGDDE